MNQPRLSVSREDSCGLTSESSQYRFNRPNAILREMSSLFSWLRKAYTHKQVPPSSHTLRWTDVFDLGSSRERVEWRFASVDAKARKRAASTHLLRWVHPSGRGRNFFFANEKRRAEARLFYFQAICEGETGLRPLFHPCATAEQTSVTPWSSPRSRPARRACPANRAAPAGPSSPCAV